MSRQQWRPCYRVWHMLSWLWICRLPEGRSPARLPSFLSPLHGKMNVWMVFAMVMPLTHRQGLCHAMASPLYCLLAHLLRVHFAAPYLIQRIRNQHGTYDAELSLLLDSMHAAEDMVESFFDYMLQVCCQQFGA